VWERHETAIKMLHSCFSLLFLFSKKKMLSQLNNRLRGQSARILLNRGLSTTRHVARPTPSAVTPDAPKEEKQGRANEIIESVLYGSKKVKEEENQTHSKMLARGKYVHEIQSMIHVLPFFYYILISILAHRVKPEKVDEYIALT
jgi:hypothetical protein